MDRIEAIELIKWNKLSKYYGKIVRPDRIPKKQEKEIELLIDLILFWANR